jgi:carboxymethylenebutenolidase
MNRLPPDHETMLDAWQQHTHAEFLLKDPDAALASMTEHPYVICIPSGIGGVGRAAVRKFYAEQFLPSIPADFELQSLSQIFSIDRIVEEFVVRFTHTLQMDWMLPGIRPTRRRAELVMVLIIQFQSGKIAREHAYWDQAAVLSQLGILDQPIAATGVGSAAELLRLSALPMRPARNSPSISARPDASKTYTQLRS